jgi:hypothetical protein
MFPHTSVPRVQYCGGYMGNLYIAFRLVKTANDRLELGSLNIVRKQAIKIIPLYRPLRP